MERLYRCISRIIDAVILLAVFMVSLPVRILDRIVYDRN